MKQNRTIGILIAVLIGMVLLIGLRSRVSPLDEAREEFEKSIASMTVDDVSEIKIATSGASLWLEAQNDEWMVDNNVAEKSAVASLLKTILEPEKVDLISENQEKHDELGVTEDSGMLIVMTGGEKELMMHLGNSSQGGRYVRVDDKVEVYLIDGLTADSDLTQAASWVDAVIIRTPSDSIARIDVEDQSGDQTTLLQKEGEWVQEENEELLLDATGFMSMLDTLAEFKSEGVVDEDVTGLVPFRTVYVTTDAIDEPVELNFYKSGDEEYVWVTNSSKSGVFEVYTTTTDNFEVNEVDLKAKEE